MAEGTIYIYIYIYISSIFQATITQKNGGGKKKIVQGICVLCIHIHTFDWYCIRAPGSISMVSAGQQEREKFVTLDGHEKKKKKNVSPSDRSPTASDR